MSREVLSPGSTPPPDLWHDIGSELKKKPNPLWGKTPGQGPEETFKAFPA